MKTERGKRYRNEKIKLYVLITVVSIVLLAWLLVVVIVFQKNHADIFFFDNNKEIEYQYGNYKADALVVDGYVYLYRSVVELGNYDKKEKLEKCGNNVIYRLSPDGTYEEFYEFEDEDALYYDVNSKLYYYDEHFYIMIGQRVYRITKDGSSAQVIYENTGGNGIFGCLESGSIICCWQIIMKCVIWICVNGTGARLSTLIRCVF